MEPVSGNMDHGPDGGVALGVGFDIVTGSPFGIWSPFGIRHVTGFVRLGIGYHALDFFDDVRDLFECRELLGNIHGTLAQFG